MRTKIDNEEAISYMADYCKKIMKNCNISSEKLAEKAHVSVDTVKRLRRGVVIGEDCLESINAALCALAKENQKPMGCDLYDIYAARMKDIEARVLLNWACTEHIIPYALRCKLAQWGIEQIPYIVAHMMGIGVQVMEQEGEEIYAYHISDGTVMRDAVVDWQLIERYRTLREPVAIYVIGSDYYLDDEAIAQGQRWESVMTIKQYNQYAEGLRKRVDDWAYRVLRHSHMMDWGDKYDGSPNTGTGMILVD